ncbi:hypothetical protein Gasu2_13750 [Galdieria sulphuraria]|uniref:Uncharacterized protein n=1 Tax=Galdieria sulphuraria TaxID=130081 RepID=M2WQN8_GALSU|nr:uncharacterized protein Gasu_62490 [Galdieria sulphuraria]EME26105.1 hypothetical protein Gasu_62490 [Galdieria sulphuraria]GJD06990.1 hypothetical protein Gasu2_13750 [Galdieria sulphuraria]|eukprot:XP_005702625.1 hypothetical protein Gasu_62490 [Galdieria sulphuraria]
MVFNVFEVTVTQQQHHSQAHSILERILSMVSGTSCSESLFSIKEHWYNVLNKVHFDKFPIVFADAAYLVQFIAKYPADSLL